MAVVDFKCLHCGHEFKGPYEPKILVERTCPKCSSNSVRRMKKTSPKPKATS